MSQELMMDLQKRVALANSARAYHELLLTNQKKLDYPNFTSVESVASGDINQLNTYSSEPNKNIVFSMKPQTEEEEKQSLLFNLQRLLTSTDATAVVDLLSEEDIRLTNQFFNKYLESIKGVKFTSVENVKDNIILFVDKVTNRVNVKIPLTNTSSSSSSNNSSSSSSSNNSSSTSGSTNQPTTSAPVVNQIPLIDQATIDQLNAMYFSLTNVVDANKKYVGDKVAHIANILAAIYNDVRVTKTSMMDLFTYIQNDLKVKEGELKLISAIARGKKSLSNSKVIPNNITEPESRLLLKGFGEKYFSARSGNGLKNKPLKFGRGAPLKKSNGKGYQGTVPNEKWSTPKVPQLYLDVTKLNNNILCIKYTANGLKKVELAVTANTRMVMIQLILNQFNYTVYNLLTDTDKKAISYFNSIFKLIDEAILPNPIEELYTKFNILKGEVLASNDNPEIIRQIKQIALELHKYKRINSAQIRNLFFELSV